MGNRTIDVRPSEGNFAANRLTPRPGRVIIGDDCRGAAERLTRAGIEVIPAPYGECRKNGGGVHCSTQPLARDPG